MKCSLYFSLTLILRLLAISKTYLVVLTVLLGHLLSSFPGSAGIYPVCTSHFCTQTAPFSLSSGTCPLPGKATLDWSISRKPYSNLNYSLLVQHIRSRLLKLSFKSQEIEISNSKAWKVTPPELMSIRGDMKMLFKFYKWGRDLEVICDLMLVSHQIGKSTKYVVGLPFLCKVRISTQFSDDKNTETADHSVSRGKPGL